MPHADVVQWSQRSTGINRALLDRERRCFSLWNTHDECIDATTRQDGPMRIRQGANTCLIIVTSQDVMNLGFSARIFPMTRENDQLVEVRITLVIVSQWGYSQLEETSHVRSSEQPNVGCVASHFFQVFLVLVSCKDGRQHIEHADEDQCDVNGLVFGKISIGKDVTPVDGRW